MIIKFTEDLENQLTEAERQVIEYINQHEDQFLKLTITELAEKSFTSPPTVSRAVRKCGYNGLSELRYKLSAKIEIWWRERLSTKFFRSLSQSA